MAALEAAIQASYRIPGGFWMAGQARP